MENVVILEWTFSPPDFFEEPIRVARSNYLMTIGNGKVEARIDPATYDKDPSMRDVLHGALNDRFLGAQLSTYTPYQLSKSSISRLYSDGHKDATVIAEGIQLTARAGISADVVLMDRDGNVVADSRRERLERRKQVADLIETYRSKDPVLAAILNSNQAAVNDPDNELIHLYEIRDALSKQFGGEVATRDALRITATQWSRFGRIADHEPLKQGRHRGRSVGTLRDATEAELKEARDIARSLVENYLQYLERQSQYKS